MRPGDHPAYQRLSDGMHSLGGSIRRCQMQRFPYGLIYEPTSVEIIIIAVAHLHQEPRYWRMRLKANI